MSTDSETDPEIERLETPKRNVHTLTESEGKNNNKLVKSM